MLAHPGETRTIKTIEQHFHWQTLSRDVQQFVQTCQTCQHYNDNTRTMDTYQPTFNAISNCGMKSIST
jgi:hypothetical protein